MKVQFPTNVKNITTSLFMPYVRKHLKCNLEEPVSDTLKTITSHAQV